MEIEVSWEKERTSLAAARSRLFLWHGDLLLREVPRLPLVDDLGKQFIKFSEFRHKNAIERQQMAIVTNV